MAAGNVPPHVEGIDVSSFQGNVNWQAVRGAGKQFAGIKATEGLGYRCPTFPRNWQRSRVRGLIRIAYHFLRPELPGSMQADFLHGYVRDSGHFVPGDAVMLDLEENDGQPAKAVVLCAEQFVRQILQQTECGVFIYTGPWFWGSLLGDPLSGTLGKCPLWLADYGPSVPALRNWPGGLSIWQYSETGHVPGIGGAVDLDRFYGSIQGLQTLCREGGRS